MIEVKLLLPWFLVQEGREGVKSKAFLREENPSETFVALVLGARRRKCVG